MSLGEIKQAQDDVDPDIRAFVESINKGYAAHASVESMSREERRKIAEMVREPWRSGGPEMFESVDFEISNVRARLHRPTNTPDLPVMLYIHGGGWTLFSIDTHDRLMREYAALANVAVIGIDYSLSPEAKFPVALNEIVDALRWIRSHASNLKVDPSRIAIGGDSAGANLAVAACLKLRDLGEPKVQALILNYGAFDPEPTSSYDRFGGPAYCLSVPEMDAFWSDYVSDPSELSQPLVAPLKADLHDIPPSFLAIAECDILTDCNFALAKKLAKSGVTVEAVVYRGATHSFLEAVSTAPLAQKALGEQAAWLKLQLGTV